jgi:hypothetical protein
LKEVEHITARHIFHHYVVVIAVLEQVNKLDNVVVLTHFEYFDLPSLLGDFNRGHLFLLDCLNCDFLARCDVLSQLNNAELTLAELLDDLVELEYIFLVHRLFKSRNPFFLHTDIVEVKNPKLRLGKDNLDWVESYLEIGSRERFRSLNKSVCKTVHHFKSFSAFLFVAE